MKATRFLIDGVVQGVGFRYYAGRTARDLGIRGYARNLSDGRVEVLAAGAAGAIRAYTKLLRRGPLGARVDSIESSEVVMVEEFAGFEVRP